METEVQLGQVPLRRNRPNPRHTAPHTPTRDPMRAASGRIQVTGRDGEILTRRRTTVGDIFHVPLELIPEGWTYQWVAVKVVGNEQILLDYNLMMTENGWRPVPADRYPGRFMPAGFKGAIVRGDQILMERPLALTQEAQIEDIRNAKQLISDRNESLKLTRVRSSLPEGFAMSNRYRGTGGQMHMSIDRAFDAPVPHHILDTGQDG